MFFLKIPVLSAKKSIGHSTLSELPTTGPASARGLFRITRPGGGKGFAFRILLNPPCAEWLFERRSLSGLLPYAGGTGEDQLWPQVLPGDVLRRMRSILQELLRNSVGHNGINHSSFLSVITDHSANKVSRGLCSADSTSPRLSPGIVRGSRGRGKDRSPFLSHERGNWQRELAPFARRPRRTKRLKGFAFQNPAVPRRDIQ